jgi:TatD DNase family protein
MDSHSSSAEPQERAGAGAGADAAPVGALQDQDQDQGRYPGRAAHTRAHRSYVDVHAHVFHEDFDGDEEAIVAACHDKGLEYVIVNGLEPISNREVLALCERHPTLYLPAIGIYPVDAACNVIQAWTHDFPQPAAFDVDAEVEFIDRMAAAGRLVAVGECGLDKFYLTDDVCMAEQERVLRKLMRVAKKHDIPIILHTRKAEARTFELLLEEGVVKADFHCFCGKAKLAQRIAEAGYYLSIPTVVERNPGFQQLVSKLPLNRLLSETDCPYQGPDRGQRNDPGTIPRGVLAMARVRLEAAANAPIKIDFPVPASTAPTAAALGGEDSAELRAECEYVRNRIRQNFRDLFGF